MRAAFHNGLYDNRNLVGCKNYANIYPEDQIKQVISLLTQGLKATKISQITGVKYSTVNAIKNKRQWAYLTKDIDFGDNYYEKTIPNGIKIQICEDIRNKLTSSEIQEKYHISISAIKYFKQKVKNDF